MSKFDPLEEAKIPEKSEDDEKNKLFGKKKKKKGDKTEAPKVEASPPPPPPPAPASSRADTKDERPPIDSVAPNKKYRVLKEKMVSVNGRMTRVRAGKILSAQHFGGPAGLQRILETGIEVEEC